MKKFFKILLYIIIVIVIVVGSYIAYIYFSESTQRNAFSIIPDDAIFIVETKNLNEAWSAVSESKIWHHLTSTEYFGDLNKSADKIDSLIKENKLVSRLLKDRQLLISAHMTSGIDYDFIFFVDIEKASKISFLSDIFGLFDYTVKKRDYKKVEITELTDNTTNKTLYIAIIDNLLAGSYTSSLIEKLIDKKEENYWNKDQYFIAGSKSLKKRNLFKFYFNYSMLGKYLKCFLDEESEQANSLSNAMAYSMFNMNFENELLSLEGSTNFFDSIPSYLNALSKVKPGAMNAYNILSDKTALYMALCFDDFNEFYESISTQFADEDSTEYANIDKNIKRIEKFLKIDLNEVFFSWIGNEIAFVKMQPESNAREQDIIVAIHTKYIDDAKLGMEKFTKQVKKRSPVKFEIIEYKNFEINYLNIKGFFKLFLGKMFGKLEKPYYTFIEDYVVFSNSPSSIMDFIDNYMKGRTLSHSEDFMDFKNKFNNKSNVTVFIQMPKLYKHLYFYSDKDTRESIHDNKEIILSFAKIGFQLTSKGNLYDTKLLAYHDESALMYEELEKMENAADDLFIEEYDTLGFKPILTEEQLKQEGVFRYFYIDTIDPTDSTLISEGMITDEKLDGLWRIYYESGNIKAAVVFIEGKADGNSMFYYDNKESTSKAEVNFTEDVINGEYKEFYENGNLKALIYMKEGEFNGNAEFYYDTGKLKLKGKFKDGIKKGKWKHYTETGELFNKEKWKKSKAIDD